MTELLPETLADIQQAKQRRPLSPTTARQCLNAPIDTTNKEVELIVEGKHALKELTESEIDEDDHMQSQSDSSEQEGDQSVIVDNISDSISAESLLETKSMRQRYRLQHKLQLPSHFKHIFNLFCQLDTYLNLLKRRRGVTWQVTLAEISRMIELSLKRNFRISHFQQILTVCPNFFIHKWDTKQGKVELYIEIPANIK